MRITREGINLSGRTIDASKYSRGYVRESYFYRVDFRQTKLLGDFRGSDFIECDLRGADLSETLIYGCLFVGSTLDATTILPPDPGPFQAELTYEYARRHIADLPTSMQSYMDQQLTAHAEGRWEDFSNLGKQAVGASGRKREEARKLWQAMPRRIKTFMRLTIKASWADGCLKQPYRTITTTWPDDGATLTLDLDNLPSLTHPDDRYELRKILQDEIVIPVSSTLKEHHFWINCIRPLPALQIIRAPEEWLVQTRFEY